MFVLWRRFPSWHRHDVRQKRRISSVVRFKQMQEKLTTIQTRRTQTKVDEVFR
jgi:hypothetical protein